MTVKTKELQVQPNRQKVISGDRISVNYTLTRNEALELFKKHQSIVRINEKGGWWDRRTFTELQNQSI